MKAILQARNGKRPMRAARKRNGQHRPIEEILMELGRQIPASEWRRLPRDLSSNIDHYLYATPKHKA